MERPRRQARTVQAVVIVIAGIVRFDIFDFTVHYVQRLRNCTGAQITFRLILLE